LDGSTRELHSAFSNLVSNAVRYTPAGGTIAIVFERDRGGAVLSVRDSGYGIPAAHLPRLTERFYRVSTSRSRGSGGTGLGLAIVKHVLNLHQARLEISSEVGRGSVFSCHFGPERVLARGGAHSGATPCPDQARRHRRASHARVRPRPWRPSRASRPAPTHCAILRCTSTASCRSWISTSGC